MEKATLIETQDGSHSLYNTAYGVSYHSKYGAIQESQHVFINAGLVPLLATKTEIRIFEMGFGTGLNAYLSLLAIAQTGHSIDYEAVETHPVSISQATALNYPTILGEPPAPFLALHECQWNLPHKIANHFSLIKRSASIQEAALSGRFDLVYYDAFAPSSQPELWEHAVLKKVYDHMAEGGIFVTYCAKGVVKRCLRDIGFQVEGIPGPPGKREMTKALKV